MRVAVRLDNLSRRSAGTQVSIIASLLGCMPHHQRPKIALTDITTSLEGSHPQCSVDFWGIRSAPNFVIIEDSHTLIVATECRDSAWSTAGGNTLRIYSHRDNEPEQIESSMFTVIMETNV